MKVEKSMKKVLVTGPTGAVGIALINELIQHGISVTAICRCGSARLSHLPKSSLVSVVECNLDSYPSLKETMSHDYDVFYHFAWDGTSGGGRNDTEKQVRNIAYTLDAVHLAKAAGCHTFIGAGSQAECGRVDGIIAPDTPCFPENGYGIAKLCAGQMSRLLCSQLGIRHIWTRILSVYGPYDGENTMVTSTIRKLLNNERPKFTPAEQMWDYLYCGDAAAAFRLLAEKGLGDKVYILGNGKARLLKEYICAIRDAVDTDAEIGIGELPYAPKQVMRLEADISLLVGDTGFKPKMDFEQGVRQTADWWRGRNNI